jgi:hypothetical protein
LDKYDVKLLPQAYRDLNGIYAYIAETILEMGTKFIICLTAGYSRANSILFVGPFSI